MKKAFFVISLLVFVNLNLFAQESGNRIYGNNNYYQQQRRQPPTNTGNLAGTNSYGQSNYAIEASVLINLKPDAFVAVFGINEEATTAAGSNDKVNARVNDFMKALGGLGVTKGDVFVDFVTQNRVYDYTVQGSQAKENLTGFETKKTIAVRYKTRDSFEKILALAAANSIFDLIKVDYIVTDFDAVRARLFDEAVKIIKAKREKYMNSLGVTKLDALGLANEKYDAFYPSESYLRYQAFETGDANSYSNNSSSIIIQRKSFTFFYDPVDASKFDTAINRLGIEPTVQYTIFLRMDYDAGQNKEK
jgi:uncharacterized protein YggE